jgi:hypothetical protein
MTRKIPALTDYISAAEAASILSAKMGRQVRPGYIHKLRNVRSVKINSTTNLYLRADIEATTIRERTDGGSMVIPPR